MSEREAQLAQKLRQYRQTSAETWKSASQAKTPELRLALEDVAKSWDQLIREIESLLRSGL
jgi:hypothetical protein